MIICALYGREWMIRHIHPQRSRDGPCYFQKCQAFYAFARKIAVAKPSFLKSNGAPGVMTEAKIMTKDGAIFPGSG